MKKQRHYDTLRILFITAWFIYFICVIYITVLSRSPEERRLDLVPLKSYIFLIRDKNYFYFNQIILNIFMTVPFGIIVPALWKSTRSFRKILISGFFFSLFIELLQLVTARGLFEFDDLFNNTLGAIAGYSVYKPVHRKLVNLIEKS